MGDLECVPLKKISYRGVILEEMDVDAILARKPEFAVVDELPHTNVAGSKHSRRYQDVEELLDHGISVITAFNIQHLESLNQMIRRITGVEVRKPSQIPFSREPTRLLRSISPLRSYVTVCGKERSIHQIGSNRC
jgi:K+-sensing histidine kinase KdpD